MKFYLSSYRLGNNPKQLLDLVGENKKVALIPNAMDSYDDIERVNESIKNSTDELEAIGLKPDSIDLRKYFGKPQELKKKLSEYKILYVRGGNTFTLRQAFKESGFDKWLISQKDNKELVYAGYSAGVFVLAPSLKGLELVDDPNAKAKGYKNETVWEGLGLIDFAFAPHYKSDHPESADVDREVEYYEKNGINYKALHDGEVIIYK